jgi:hypothetical protein
MEGLAGHLKCMSELCYSYPKVLEVILCSIFEVSTDNRRLPYICLYHYVASFTPVSSISHYPAGTDLIMCTPRSHDLLLSLLHLFTDYQAVEYAEHTCLEPKEVGMLSCNHGHHGPL